MHAQRHAWVRAAAACGAVLGLAGCSAPATQEAPATFTQRAALPSCGAVELGQGESVDASAWDCLDAAALHDGAELVVTGPTTEGDPITTYYRVGPDIDGLELFRDATADRFGAEGWSHQLCPGTATAATPLDCTEV
ncbi:hypothetical protein [uncultured Cellulomonas sp.]|uniref:hypothetical protein n=1 Tax=uncultured Cellulomonas sp. TaxID=189682 RepID=UPI0028EF996C|nr:hypothetical protein [uncultured Cellulomonas sp.]